MQLTIYLKAFHLYINFMSLKHNAMIANALHKMYYCLILMILLALYKKSLYDNYFFSDNNILLSASYYFYSIDINYKNYILYNNYKKY